MLFGQFSDDFCQAKVNKHAGTFMLRSDTCLTRTSVLIYNMWVGLWMLDDFVREQLEFNRSWQIERVLVELLNPEKNIFILHDFAMIHMDL